MMPYILVLYYSKTGSVAQLAQHIARGIAHVDGIEARIRTVPLVSPTCEMVESPVPDSGAPYVTLDELRECSGLAMGSPTRFGNMAAPLKYFLDTTTALWFEGALIGKPACVFSSTSSMHGGQETTLLSMMIPLFHHGMLLMGLPYSEPALTSTTMGGTPYGATRVTGNQPQSDITNDEAELARHMGERLARTTLQLLKN